MTPKLQAGFDGTGKALPAEMLPAKIQYHDVEFDLALAKTGTPNAVSQKARRLHCPKAGITEFISLPQPQAEIKMRRSRSATQKVDLKIQDWTGFIGQWDTRLWNNEQERNWAISANHAVWPPVDLQQREQRPVSPRYPEDYVGLKAGYVKPASLAWYASHQHTADGLNQPYQYSYLFAYPIEVSDSVRTLRLPNNEKIRILAISAVNENPRLTPAEPLYDTLTGSANLP